MTKNSHFESPRGGIEYQSGGYFMSQEQQDAVIGRVVRELNSATILAAALSADAHQIGTALIALGMKLQGKPQEVARIAFHNQSVPLQFQPVEMFAPELLDAAKIARLTDGLRNALSDVRRLSDNAASLGV
jgi:hypothetical protein